MNLLRIIICTFFIHSKTIKSFNNALNELKYSDNLEYISRGKSPITDPLLIPTPSRISVTIRDIKK